jgi:predicted nuclease of predicted toxin-antitoxin system
VRVKLDENLPAEFLADLQAAGHDADSVASEGLTGSPDPTILAAALSDGRVLLTLDKGLADLRQHPRGRSPGVVLFRPASTGRGTTLAFVRRHLALLHDRDLTGRLLVVTERSARLR